MAKSATDDTADQSSADPEPDAPEPAPERRKTVTVHCSVANGLHLSIDRPVTLPVSSGGDGYSVIVPHQRVKIAAGPNSGIDAGFWDAWLKENISYPAVMSGHIFATEDP